MHGERKFLHAAKILHPCFEAGALERQFRLLREDMVGPARKELMLLRNGEGNLRNLFNGVAIEKVDIPYGKTSTPPHVLVSFDLPSEHKTIKYDTVKDRKEYWETFSKGNAFCYTSYHFKYKLENNMKYSIVNY